MDCLKRAIKIADITMNQAKNLYLFAIILNKFLYYYSIDAEFVSFTLFLILLQISADDINNLIDLIKEHIDHIEGGAEDQIKDAMKFLQNTKIAIKNRQDEQPKYKALNIQLI